MGTMEWLYFSSIKVIANVGLAQLLPGCAGACTFECGDTSCNGGYVPFRVYKYISSECFIYTGTTTECMCDLNQDPYALQTIFKKITCPSAKIGAGSFTDPLTAADLTLSNLMIYNFNVNLTFSEEITETTLIDV